MKKMNKFGLLTTSALLSMAMLVSCSSKEEEETPEVTMPELEVSEPKEEDEVEIELEEVDEEESDEETEEETEDELEEEATEEDSTEDTEETEEAVTPAKLSTSDFTLGSAGATTKIAVQNGQDVKDISYSSDNTGVATVANDGTVTAVANGTAKITVKFTSEGKSQTLTASVRCNIAEATPEPEPAPEPEPTPEPEPAPEPEPTPEPEPAPAPASADLTAFYNQMISSHGFGSMERMDGAFLNAYYPGLSGIASNQMVVGMASIATSAMEIGVVEVTNSADVGTVKAIFQKRISDQVAGGAFYEESIAAWKTQASVVSKGNYVMIVVHPNHSSIVASFNGL